MKEPDANASLATPIRRPHRWRVALAGLVILAAGITLGIAGTLLVAPPGQMSPPMPVDRATQALLGRLGQELELSEKQVERAVELSADKYCSASIMMRNAGVKVTHDFEIVEE